MVFNNYFLSSHLIKGDLGTLMTSQIINPLNPHDALKHHVASLKNGLIS